MVCPRCIRAVRQLFVDLDLAILSIDLGRVILPEKLKDPQKLILENQLIELGFELLDDKQAQLINEIKSIIIQEVHHKSEPSPINYSTLLSEKLHFEYGYLSRLFSSVEGRTIEKFIIAQKIEKVKELLTYREMTLSEIAFQMNYSSSAHLSAQFKKVTGMSPTAFKEAIHFHRQSLDEV